jgi:hypothetical protein
MADMFEQLRLAQQAQDTPGKGKPLSGALGAMLGGLGIKLYDVDAFSLKNPNGLFTKDVDMTGLFRNTKAGEVMGKAHGDIKQAAEKIQIAAPESGDGFQWSQLPRNQRGGTEGAELG